MEEGPVLLQFGSDGGEGDIIQNNAMGKNILRDEARNRAHVLPPPAARPRWLTVP